VHRRRRADDLIDRAAPAGRQRSADHGDDADAGRNRVAPRSCNRERNVSDASVAGRNFDRWGGETGHAKHRQVGRRIPTGELGVQRCPVVSPYLNAFLAANGADGRDDNVVAVYEPAGRPPASLHLNDGGSRRSDGIGQLIGK